jgi:prepilin-type N-terminal cleavage/methylation domain-containing protein
MATTMNRTATIRRRTSPVRRQTEHGFSLLEVVISMVILTVGMVSLLGVFGLAMAATQTSQQDMIAKQLANEAYESIVTAHNTSQLNWDQIQNADATNCPITGTSPCGIFTGATNSPTFEPLYNAGADGIFGTADDATAGEQTLQDPGPDGIFQTADDTFIPLTGYQRAIQLQPVVDSSGNTVTSVRSVTITVKYATSQAAIPKTYILNSYISEY